MCRKAPRRLRSLRLPERNSAAVMALITTPTPATSITVSPTIATGCCRRWIDSQPSEPMATSKIEALTKLARIEPRRQP
ncbi:hypothetical protein D3C84_1098840 [compost metagenome]